MASMAHLILNWILFIAFHLFQKKGTFVFSSLSLSMTVWVVSRHGEKKEMTTSKTHQLDFFQIDVARSFIEMPLRTIPQKMRIKMKSTIVARSFDCASYEALTKNECSKKEVDDEMWLERDVKKDEKLFLANESNGELKKSTLRRRRSPALLLIFHTTTHSTPTMCSSFLYPHLVSFSRRCHCDYNTIVHAAYVLQWCVSIRFSLSLAFFFGIALLRFYCHRDILRFVTRNANENIAFVQKNNDVFWAPIVFAEDSHKIISRLQQIDRHTHWHLGTS